MNHIDNINLRVFVSQPMSGLSDEAVKETRLEAEKAIDKYFSRFNNSKVYEIVTTYYDKEAKDAEHYRFPKLYRLGHALMVLASCDYVYFAGNWKNKRSCILEFVASRMFGVNIIGSNIDASVSTTANIEIIDTVTRKYEY
ncbi:MAG: hypothetical protein IKR19_08715 [Acholeplasmatales bacterium]|nr:hypothetical protein [Acholeplasmatales bacterium]